MYVGNSSGIVMFNIATIPETIIIIFGLQSPTFLRFNPFNNTLYAYETSDSSFFDVYADNGTFISTTTSSSLDIFFDRYGNTFSLVYATNTLILFIYNSAGEYIGNVTGIPDVVGIFTITSNGTLVFGATSALIPAELPIKYPTSSSYKTSSGNVIPDNTNSSPKPFRDTTGFIVVVSLSGVIGIAVVTGFFVLLLFKRKIIKSKVTKLDLQQSSIDYTAPVSSQIAYNLQYIY